MQGGHTAVNKGSSSKYDGSFRTASLSMWKYALLIPVISLIFPQFPLPPFPFPHMKPRREGYLDIDSEKDIKFKAFYQLVQIHRKLDVPQSALVVT